VASHAQAWLPSHLDRDLTPGTRNGMLTVDSIERWTILLDSRRS
jgi:hypothetical protein